MALTREDFESDETWAKYQAKKAEKEPAREPAAAPGISREEAFRRKSADYSQLGGSFTRAAKAKRSENWGAFAHSGLIALDLASLGTLGVARITGEHLRTMKEGPRSRPLSNLEKIDLELQIMQVRQAQAQARAAREAGDLQAERKFNRDMALEQAKLHQKVDEVNADNTTKRNIKYMETTAESRDITKEHMIAEQAIFDGKLSDKGKAVANEYASKLKGLDRNTSEFQTAMREIATDLGKMDSVVADNILTEVEGRGVPMREAVFSDDLQHIEGVTILKSKINDATQDREAMLVSIGQYAKEVDELDRRIESVRAGGAGRITIGADGRPVSGEYTREGSATASGLPELDVSYLRDLIEGIPDVRPESQKIIEEARETDAYRYAMEEVGLNPDDVIDQEIYEKESRTQMRKLKRLKRRALRKGVPLEQLPQFQEYLAEAKAGGQGAPKLSSMRKQLLLMYAGVDIDALTGAARGQGIMGEDLDALPEAEGLSIAERTAAQKDQLQGNLGASSRLANLRGVEEELPLLQPSAAVLDKSWETLSDEEKAELEELGIYRPGTGREESKGDIETLGEYIPDPLPEEPRRGGHLSGVRRPLTVRGSDVEPAARRSKISQLPPETASSDIFRDFGESSTEVPEPSSDIGIGPMRLKTRKQKIIEGLPGSPGAHYEDPKTGKIKPLAIPYDG